MGTRMNRTAYAELVAGDLEWLQRQPHSLERTHIEQIVRSSVDMHYPPDEPSEPLPSPDPLSMRQREGLKRALRAPTVVAAFVADVRAHRDKLLAYPRPMTLGAEAQGELAAALDVAGEVIELLGEMLA